MSKINTVKVTILLLSFLNPLDNPPNKTNATAKTHPLTRGVIVFVSNRIASTIQTLRKRNPAVRLFMKLYSLRLLYQSESHHRKRWRFTKEARLRRTDSFLHVFPIPDFSFCHPFDCSHETLATRLFCFCINDPLHVITFVKTNHLS